ncbi:MAG TPA: hypothetical protein VMM56_01455 [Planctomycetaceae bacterium]|nr:hypothetical protein [Planctomycetaceae bacterium]
MTFSPPHVLGREAESSRVTAISPEGAPDFAGAQIEGSKLLVTVRTRVTGRKTRKIQLLSSNE